MTLRVDFLHPRLDPRVYKEAMELLKRDYEITVFCWTKKDSGYPKDEEYHGIRIKRIPHGIPPSESSRIMKGPPYFKLVRDMALAVKRYRPDIIHSHDTDTLLEGSFAHKSLKVPFIYDSHEDYPGMVVANYPLLARGTTFLEKLLIPGVDHVIAATAGIKKKFDGMGMETTLVYNSRPAEDFVRISAGEKKALREKHELDKDDFIVGYAGALGYTHSTDMLIKILPRIKNKKIKLMFIGGPPAEDEKYVKMIKSAGLTDRIVILPFLPFKDVMKYYQIMDAGTILYHPTRNYIVGAPNKLFEFMGYGIPMINSELPEMHTILIDDGESSILIDPFDEKAIVDSIEKLAADPGLCRKYSKRLKELMKSKYNWELQRNKLYRVYDLFML